MTYYRITAKLKAPLSVQGSRQADARRSLPYLPGTGLRGALAAKFLRSGGDPDSADFKTLFLEGPPAFPNLLPSNADGTVSPRVLPLTAESCKRHPGFRTGDTHGVGDALVKKLVDRYHPGQASKWLCPMCGKEDMKAIAGFWNGNTDGPAMFQPTMFFQRHTGIDRHTGTIAPKIFFMTQAMADFRKVEHGKIRGGDEFVRQTLSAGIYLDGHQHEALKPLLNGVLFAGSDRTRGMGELRVEITPAKADCADVSAWDRQFKSRLDALAGGLGIPDLPEGLYFSLTLESHAILVDEFLRPTPKLILDFPDIVRVMKIIKPGVIQGWNQAWGLSKPDETGVMMGGVYLFCYIGRDVKELQAFLDRTQQRGIGLRREEGFGRVRICDPFHILDEEVI